MNKPRLISAAQYNDTGRDRHKLVTAQKRGELVRVRRGIYVQSAEWSKLSGRERYGLRVLACARLAQSEPVFCHATAALLWGLWIVGVPQKLHTVTEVTRGGRSSSGVVRHVGSRTEGVQRCGPVLITDKLTTTMQLINSLSFSLAVTVCDSALRVPRRSVVANHFERPDADPFQWDATWELDEPQGAALLPEELRAAAAQLPSKAGQTRALKVINFASALSGSAGESLSRVKMFELGFPAPVLQQRFSLDDGRGALVDFWFKEERAVGEFDGKGKYLRDDWSQGRSMTDRIMAEKRRENQIRAQVSGFARWDWQDLKDTQRFTSILRQAGLRQK